MPSCRARFLAIVSVSARDSSEVQHKQSVYAYTLAETFTDVDTLAFLVDRDGDEERTQQYTDRVRPEAGVLHELETFFATMKCC